MSAPLTLLISKSDLVGVVPQFSANIDTNHFAAARKFANERFKNLVPSTLYDDIVAVYALSAWSNAATYASGDKVVLSDRGYEANQSTSAGQSPLTHPAKWDEIEMYSVWRDYIKPFLCWQAYAKFLPFHGTFVSQGGMKQHVDLSSEPVPADKLAIAIQNAQSTADGYYMDFQKYLSDNANTIDGTVYVFTGTTTFKPKIGIRMIKMILLFLLPLAAEAQYYPLPIVHEARNYHFKKYTYVDGKLKVGDPGDPTVNRKLHVVADTIRFEGLDGTGTLLTIDANGDVIKGTAGATGVTGLNNQQILYGKSDGTIDQEADFYYDESINSLIIVDGVKASLLNGFSYTVTDGTWLSGYYADRIEMNDGTHIATWNFPTSLAATFDMYFPNTQGAANTFLKNDGSGNLSWAAGGTGTVTSIATTSPITGGTITGTGTIGINNAAADGSTKGAASFTANDFDASSGNISIDYTNAQKASASVSGFVSTSAQDIAGTKTFQNDLAFEGSTADANETTLTATDPTADNTVTIQNVTGSIPMAVGTPVSLTGQTAAIAATTAYTAPEDGYYMVCYNATVTTAATSSCVLGPFQVRYTEATDNVVKTFPTSSVNFVNQTNRNNTDAAIGGVFTVHAKSGANIQYIMGYTSSGATAMQYNLEVTVIKIR